MKEWIFTALNFIRTTLENSILYQCYQCKKGKGTFCFFFLTRSRPLYVENVNKGKGAERCTG